jgi:hypothetical protein
MGVVSVERGHGLLIRRIAVSGGYAVALVRSVLRRLCMPLCAAGLVCANVLVTHIYEWQWDCYMGEGISKAWNPAKSVAYYTPQADGTLRGSWRTDIYGGPCDGNVIMDIAAIPVR